MGSAEHLTPARPVRVLRWAVGVAAGGLSIMLISLVAWSLVPVIAGWHGSVVMSGSMRPAIEPGDVVVAAPVDAASLLPGQVVLVDDPAHPGRKLVHRIVEARDDGTFVTRGDANARPDSTAVTAEEVRALPRLRVPWVGLPALWLRTHDYLPLVATGGGLVALVVLALGTQRQAARHAAPQPAGHRALGVSAIAVVATAVVLVATTSPQPAASRFAASTSNPGNALLANATFPDYPTSVKADAPLFYLRADDVAPSTTMADASGKARPGVYNGTVAPPISVSGPAGTGDTAISFPSSGYAISAAEYTLPAKYTVTLEIWFKTATPGSLLALSNGPSSADASAPPQLFIDAGGKLCGGVQSSALFSACSSQSVNDNVWHQAVFTVGTGGALTLYIDGTQAGTGSGGSVLTKTAIWRIGSAGSIPGGYGNYISQSAFTGELDDAAIYPTALSAARVSAHYAARTGNYSSAVLTDAPDLYWRLGETSETSVVADASGKGRTGTFSGFVTGAFRAGQSGALTGSQLSSTAMRFNGTAGAYNPVQWTNPNPFTIEFWFRTETTSGGQLAGFGSSTTGASTSVDRVVYLRNDGRVSFGVNPGTRTVITSTAPYNDNAWHLVQASLGAAGMRLYIDGAQVAANSGVTTARNGTGYWRFGGDSLTGWPSVPTSTYVAATLDEIAVYGTQLGAQQIAWRVGANR